MFIGGVSETQVRVPTLPHTWERPAGNAINMVFGGVQDMTVQTYNAICWLVTGK